MRHFCLTDCSFKMAFSFFSKVLTPRFPDQFWGSAVKPETGKLSPDSEFCFSVSALLCVFSCSVGAAKWNLWGREADDKK